MVAEFIYKRKSAKNLNNWSSWMRPNNHYPSVQTKP
jgi:hypothetical protein